MEDNRRCESQTEHATENDQSDACPIIIIIMLDQACTKPGFIYFNNQLGAPKTNKKKKLGYGIRIPIDFSIINNMPFSHL